MLVSRPSFAPSSAVAQFPAQNSHTTDRSRPAKHCRQRLVRLLFTGVLCLYLFAAAVPSQSICREWREKGLVLLNGAGNRSRAGLAAICGHASGSCNPNSNRRAKAAAQPQADDGRTHVGGRPLTRGHVASHPHKKCRRGMPADQAKRDCQQKLIILGGIRQMQIPSQSPLPFSQLFGPIGCPFSVYVCPIITAGGAHHFPFAILLVPSVTALCRAISQIIIANFPAPQLKLP